MSQPLNRVGRLPIRLLWLSGALVCLVCTWWILALWEYDWNVVHPAWQATAKHIEARSGVSEMVLLHQADKVEFAGSFSGLPTVCDNYSQQPKLRDRSPASLWVVGSAQIDDSLRKLLERFRKTATLSYGPVNIEHGWHPKDPEGTEK